MRTIKLQGLIIQKYNFGEKDCGVMLFTSDYGKLFAYARGARNIKSKFTGHFDLLNICNFEIYKSANNFLITDCSLVKNHENYGKNLIKFYAVEEILKMVRTYTTENEDSEEIYALIIETLGAINSSKKEKVLLEAFKIKFFLLLGMMPDLQSNLDDNEFAPVSIRMKKLIKFILQNSYRQIAKITLNKDDENELSKITMMLSEQI